jgi:prefoldin subunit 5
MYGPGCNCTGYGEGIRSFLTKEEKIEILREYKDNLEKEAKGVAERIKDLEKNN